MQDITVVMNTTHQNRTNHISIPTAVYYVKTLGTHHILQTTPPLLCLHLYLTVLTSGLLLRCLLRTPTSGPSASTATGAAATVMASSRRCVQEIRKLKTL